VNSVQYSVKSCCYGKPTDPFSVAIPTPFSGVLGLFLKQRVKQFIRHVSRWNLQLISFTWVKTWSTNRHIAEMAGRWWKMMGLVGFSHFAPSWKPISLNDVCVKTSSSYITMAILYSWAVDVKLAFCLKRNHFEVLKKWHLCDCFSLV